MEQSEAPPANLAKGDDPHGAGLAAGLSEIELAFRLEVRPAVHRACRPLDRDAQAIGPREDRRLLGVLGLRRRQVVSRRCGGDGESDSARDQGGGGHSDDRLANHWFEHFVPYSSRGRTQRQRTTGLNVPNRKSIKVIFPQK